MRIGVLGATGAAGRQLVPLLLGHDHQVRVAVRSGNDAVRYRTDGMEAVVCDILDAATLPSFASGCEVIVNLATRIPRRPGPAAWVLNDRIRTEGTANLIAACRSAGVRRILQQSIAMLHCASAAEPQNEDSPRIGAGPLASALAMEELILQSGLDWQIIRGALFYGPGTGRAEAFEDAMHDPAYRMPGTGEDWLTLVHVEDFARAIVTILEQAPACTAWIACDDEPLLYRTLFERLAARFDRPLPPSGGPLPVPSFRVTNRRLKSLGWEPLHSI
jgi:nucleoside-diphosphate-sugar epimerase